MKKGMTVEETVSDLIFEAAISRAIEDNRELLQPSIQHFLDGGKVNGQFLIHLKKLMTWTEKKTLEACAKVYTTQTPKP